MKYIILVLFGVILALGATPYFGRKEKTSLQRKLASQIEVSKGLDTKVKGLEAAAKAAEQSNQNVAVIEGDLAEGIRIVEREVKTSSCGPAVDAAIDRLRDDKG